MTKVNLTALIATTGLTGIAFGDFSGFSDQNSLRYYASDGATATDFNGAAYAVLDVYATFYGDNTHGYSNEDTRMLNVLNANFTLNNTATGFFYQNDLTGSGSTGAGSWKPSFSFDVPGSANSAIDSFVTIGGSVGAGAATNATTPDPNLGDALAENIFNADVGWFLNPPNSPQGAIDSDLTMWVGRFVVSGDDARNGANFNMGGSVGYNYGEGTGAYFGDDAVQNFTFVVPAPSALAFMGLSGAFFRRRRG